jgi:hypothetical protein
VFDFLDQVDIVILDIDQYPCERSKRDGFYLIQVPLHLVSRIPGLALLVKEFVLLEVSAFFPYREAGDAVRVLRDMVANYIIPSLNTTNNCSSADGGPCSRWLLNDDAFWFELFLYLLHEIPIATKSTYQYDHLPASVRLRQWKRTTRKADVNIPLAMIQS